MSYIITLADMLVHYQMQVTAVILTQSLCKYVPVQSKCTNLHLKILPDKLSIYSFELKTAVVFFSLFFFLRNYLVI